MRKFFALGILVLLLTSAVARIVSAGLSTLPEVEAESPQDATALLCPPSGEVAALLKQIEARDQTLDQREATLAVREQDMRVARQEILASLDTLAEAEARLEARMHQSNTASAEDVARLTAVYEGMKPKDAAVLFEAMEVAFASGFLSRMRPDAAAAIFSNLSPEKAYALSVMMAGRNANAATEISE